MFNLLTFLWLTVICGHYTPVSSTVPVLCQSIDAVTGLHCGESVAQMAPCRGNTGCVLTYLALAFD